VRLVHVARGNHLAFLQGKERIGVPISHASTAYDAQADARRRRRLAGPSEHAAGDDGGEGQRRPAQTQELTTIQLSVRRRVLHRFTTRR